MKKRFANTNCLLLLLLILSLLPLLCGCAAQSEQTTLYVKKIELDKDEIGFRLYVTVLSEDAFTGSKGASDKSDKSDTADESDKSEKSDTSDTSADGASTEKNAAGLASSGRDTAESDPTTLVYGGKTPRDAFDAFFAANPVIYTGTLEAYVFGDTLTEDDLFETALYLLDSPSLPLKILVRDRENASESRQNG